MLIPVKSAVRISRKYVRAKCEFARIHNLLTVKMQILYPCEFNASISVRNSQGVAPIMTPCQHAHMEFALDGLHTILAYFARMISANNSYNSQLSSMSMIMVTGKQLATILIELIFQEEEELTGSYLFVVFFCLVIYNLSSCII